MSEFKEQKWRWDRKKLIKKEWICDKVTQDTIKFAEEFGGYLAKQEKEVKNDQKKADITGLEVKTSQLRKFFGEVKRQQITPYNESSFIMLKPKLAYAVGRARKDCKNNQYCKIEDLFIIISNAIDIVVDAPEPIKAFKNFIDIFEAIVAYHKASVIKDN